MRNALDVLRFLRSRFLGGTVGKDLAIPTLPRALLVSWPDPAHQWFALALRR